MTGGTSGIGRAVVETFLAEGAHVVFTGRRAEVGAALAATLALTYPAQRVVFVAGDVRRAEECAAAVAAAVAAGHGTLDILFNNAGIVVGGGIADTSEEAWAEVMDTNVTAVWRFTKLVAPLMAAQPRGGAIINNASDWGLVASPAAAAYCVSKAAVIQLTRAAALEYARARVRINAVCPGDTVVERWATDGYFVGSGAVSPAAAAADAAHLPMGRAARPEEIARTVAFLASDDASYMTGSCLVVDGGNTAQ